MYSSLILVLKKVFVSGFYKTYAGAMLFLFIVLISYLFFINTLGTVKPDVVDFWQFFFVINLVSNPMFLMAYLIGSLFYAYKSSQYISNQLRLSTNEFFFYSLTTLKKGIQFKSWLIVQLFIFMPLLVFTFYAIAVGFIFRYYNYSIFLSTYLISLILLSTCFCIYASNRFMDAEKQPFLLKITKKWKKPFFTLYTFYIFARLKIAYLLTKFSSWLFISSVFLVFKDLKSDINLLMIIALLIAIIHIFLVYQEKNFSDKYLMFLRNFPYPSSKLFLISVMNYIILLFPELLMLFSKFSYGIANFLFLFVLSMVVLFSNVLLMKNIELKGFLIFVFILFIFFYLVILFNFGWILIPLNFACAFLIFRKNYLNERLLE